MRASVAVGVMMVIGLLATGCDAFYSYDIVNNTDTDLQTWVMKGDCDPPVGQRSDYRHARLVPAGATVHNGGAWSGIGSLCLQVATIDRHLVMSLKYDDSKDYGRTYVVEEPLTLGQQVPPEDELPEDGRRFLGSTASIVVLAIATLIGIPFAALLVYGIRRALADLRSYRKSGT